MTAPTRLDCLTARRDERCDRPECPEHIPPVDGDPRRRLPLCGLAVDDVAVALGGLSQRATAWMLGLSHARVGQIERRAVRRLRVVVDEGWAP